MSHKDYNFARKGYDAYSASTGGKSLITGDPLPVFDVLKDEIKDAWYAAADAVACAALDAHAKAA